MQEKMGGSRPHTLSLPCPQKTLTHPRTGVPSLIGEHNQGDSIHFLGLTFWGIALFQPFVEQKKERTGMYPICVIIIVYILLLFRFLSLFMYPRLNKSEKLHRPRKVKSPNFMKTQRFEKSKNSFFKTKTGIEEIQILDFAQEDSHNKRTRI